MTNPAAPAPAERFAITLQWLSNTVAAMSGGDRLANFLIALIITRIRVAKQSVERLIAQIQNGTYAPRHRSTPPRQPAVRKPREPIKLPQTYGWLLKLVPDAIGYRAQLEYLLQDADMLALLAAAPVSLGRPLRSLCWMLRLPPPTLIAPPKRPAKPRPPRAPRPRRQPLSPDYPPTPPDAPAWMRLVSDKQRHTTRWPWRDRTWRRRTS